MFPILLSLPGNNAFMAYHVYKLLDIVLLKVVTLQPLSHYPQIMKIAFEKKIHSFP